MRRVNDLIVIGFVLLLCVGLPAIGTPQTATGAGAGASAGVAEQATWTTLADSLRGQNGKRVTYVCPPDGEMSSRLWGTDLYTDDSSVCTAAVHAGLITTKKGGNITIEIRAGADSYPGTTRNGVTSQDYGSFGGSFVFVGSDSKIWTGGPGEATWTMVAASFRGQNGKRFTYTCPADGSISSGFWGTDLYTDDSSICTAAVHAGLITAKKGGTVTIEIRAGADSYRGSTRNGVTSQNYGSFSGSFVFVKP